MRRYGIMAIKAIVSVALLAFLLSRVDVKELWADARQASIAWLLIALGIYTLNIVASVRRWHLLLKAQHVPISSAALFGSLLVAGFFNNFLPSNIGGDVIRIRDTAPAAGSKTLATTIVLVDRGLGLMALVLIAAVGATMAAELHGSGTSPIWPSWLWAMFVLGVAVTGPAIYFPAAVERVLQPLKRIHAEWVEQRIETMVEALGRFKARPSAVFGCFAGAILVQGLVVVFYVAVAEALNIPIHSWDLAVIVPLSLVVQMLPVSVNGFGIREATFSLYFTRIGLPIASGVLLSLVAAAVMMVFSLSGAAVYIARGR
ncbi:MAG: flippase-like domain-containing protein [Acidobacteriaceae bacterium]|nr:flippase-like domain-containing protein [Acidobacteriaceae bacterium]